MVTGRWKEQPEKAQPILATFKAMEEADTRTRNVLIQLDRTRKVRLGVEGDESPGSNPPAKAQPPESKP